MRFFATFLVAILVCVGPVLGQGLLPEPIPSPTPTIPLPQPPPPQPQYMIRGFVQAVNGQGLPSWDWENPNPGWAAIQMILWEVGPSGHSRFVAQTDCFGYGGWVQGCAYMKDGGFLFFGESWSELLLSPPRHGHQYLLQVWGQGYMTRWVRVPADGNVGVIKLANSPIEELRIESLGLKNGVLRYTPVFTKPSVEKMLVKIKTNLFSPTLGLPYGIVNFEKEVEASVFTNWTEVTIPIQMEIPPGQWICAEVVVADQANPFLQYARSGFCINGEE